MTTISSIIVLFITGFAGLFIPVLAFFKYREYEGRCGRLSLATKLDNLHYLIREKTGNLEALQEEIDDVAVVKLKFATVFG
ncbi:MAG: hypothetical protein M0T73_13725 [Deltaproteobacteria bacterium]|nr:hypothetical protein [Deltaproteobacteria bacterium]